MACHSYSICWRDNQTHFKQRSFIECFIMRTLIFSHHKAIYLEHSNPFNGLTSSSSAVKTYTQSFSDQKISAATRYIRACFHLRLGFCWSCSVYLPEKTHLKWPHSRLAWSKTYTLRWKYFVIWFITLPMTSSRFHFSFCRAKTFICSSCFHGGVLEKISVQINTL